MGQRDFLVLARSPWQALHQPEHGGRTVARELRAVDGRRQRPRARTGGVQRPQQVLLGERVDLVGARFDHVGLEAADQFGRRFGVGVEGRGLQVEIRVGFLERVELKPSTKKSITDPSVLLREIADIRRSAIAIDDGEYNAEVRCVAVPVFNFTGDVIGALGISGPIWRMTDEVLKSRAKQVQAAASRLSAEFGAKG